MALFAWVTGKTELKFSWERFWHGFKMLISVGFPVALVEELVFRIAPFWIFNNNILVIILTSLLFALVHFLYGMYAKVEDIKEAVMLYTGLAILGFAMYFLNMAHPWWNVIYHASIITGVSVTALVFTKEEAIDKWWWDEGHAVIRTPLAWVLIILSTWFLCS